jgi:hypothetical protein
VKIFSSAQYSAAGFDPGTSTSTYDSGYVFTTGTSVILPPLVNGTYKVYVAVAQQVNGAYQWSAWTPSAAYTLNITPPPAAAVTATVENASARILLAITGAGAANSVLDVFQIDRSFDSGVTWEQVRSDTVGGYLENVGGVRTWYDYETGNGQAVVYRARTITYDTVGNALIGAYGSNSSSVAWTSVSSWLKVATRPDLNQVVLVKELGDESFDVPMGIFQGLDSDEAVTVSGVRRARPDSSVTLLAQTAAERVALRAALAVGEPILFHAGPRVEDWYGTSKWLSVGRMNMVRQIRGAWDPLRGLELPYTEVERLDPGVYLVEFGTKTWQDVDDAFASFTALSAAYTTYGAIRT